MPGIADVRSVCTQYAADLMAEQMKLALIIEYSVNILSDSQDVVKIVHTLCLLKLEHAHAPSSKLF